jgi:hypothetical protein
MNDLIPLKFRLLSAGFYLIGSMPILLILSIVLFLTLGGTIVNTINCLLIVVYLVLVVASLMMWMRTSEIHPFAEKSRRAAINYVLNNLVAILFCVVFCIFVFTMTCGIGSQDLMPILLSLLLFACIMLAYFINSVVAAIFALRGYSFRNRLIYPFMRDE